MRGIRNRYSLICSLEELRVNMKIAIVCTEKLPVPPVRGGAIQLYIDGILPYLSSRHDITVFCVTDADLPDQELASNPGFIRVPANQYLENVKRELSGRHFDLIHVFNRPKWILELLSIAPGSKFMLNLHNEMFRPKKIPANQAHVCIQRLEKIATISDFIAKGVVELYPEAAPKITTVYSAADIDRIRPVWSDSSLTSVRSVTKEKLGIRDKRVVLYVGRLSEKKGTHILLQAMQEVVSHCPDIVLLVVGSKWYGKNEVDDYVSLLHRQAATLGCKVVFTGFICPQDIYEYYACGDLAVITSQWEEPLSRVHYEVMAAGLPIITTNRGGNAEVVAGQGTGIVIDDFDNPAAFSRAISYLLFHPDEARMMGAKARALAEHKFHWERVGKDILRLYAEIENGLLP